MKKGSLAYHWRLRTSDCASQYRRVALPVIELLFLYRQVVQARGFEALLEKPVCALCREHKDVRQRERFRLGEQFIQQLPGAACATIVRMRRDTGDLSHTLGLIRIECGAGQHPAIPFQNGKISDLFFKPFAGPFNQCATVFERAYHLNDTGDIVDVR